MSKCNSPKLEVQRRLSGYLTLTKLHPDICLLQVIRNKQENAAKLGQTLPESNRENLPDIECGMIFLKSNDCLDLVKFYSILNKD